MFDGAINTSAMRHRNARFPYKAAFAPQVNAAICN